MTLENLFEQISMSTIDEWISKGKEEDWQLDFKIANSSNMGSVDDKRNLAKAISGFSNSAGGLIVWGVDARKNAEGIDCAIGKYEIDDVRLFLSRLNELTSSASSPLNDKVRHKALFTDPSPKKGCAVTLVPEADGGPYMAKLGEDRYYKRCGDTFYKLEHFDLEDMFGRRKKPSLSLSSRVLKASRSEAIIFLGLRNNGRGTAYAPYFAFDVPAPFALREYGIDGNGKEGLPRLHHAGQELMYRYGASSNFVIHPGVVHEIAAIHVQSSRDDIDSILPEILQIRYEAAAEGIALKQDIFTLELKK